MRLHALILAILVLGAHSATLPDKKDIEKKLTDAVKEVLEKDDATINTASEQELIDQANTVKDVENNLRKGVQVADIPVKVVVESPQQLKISSEVKENNEVADSDESSEIKRVEVDLKNPGPPQIMLHDNQNPDHYDTAQQVQEHHTQTLSSMWRSSPQYAAIQQNIENIKSSISQLTEYWSKSAQQPVEEGVQVRTSEKAESSGCSNAPSSSSSSNNTFGLPPFGSGPFATGWSNWVTNIQDNIQQLNTTFTNYIGNNTSGNNFGTNLFNFGNASSTIASQANSSSSNLSQSADDPKPQQPWWQGITNIFNPQQNQAPPSAQSDTPQPNRPVINAITSVIGNFVPRPQTAPAVEPAQPAAPVTQEGSNSVPAKNPEPEQQKDKPQEAQPVTQSGPIKQFIGRNPIVQGLAGAVQRIQHTIVPPKPRDEVKETAEKDGQATKWGFKPPPSGYGPIPGDNIDVSSSGVAVKSEIEAEKPEVPVQEPIKEESAPVVPEKTE